MSVRSVLEVVARDWRFKRRLPLELGGAPIWVSPGAGLRYLLKRMQSVDPILLGLAIETVRKGDVVWDVGANVGLFSIASANLAGPAGRVVACEPDEWLVGLLRRSASAQATTAAPITIVSAAVANEVDLRTFCVAKRGRATSFLAGYGSSQTGGISEERAVVSITLDWLSERLPRPNVLKVDVEGAELEVLQGATRLLSTVRPVIICEVGAKAVAGVSALLRRFDYVFLDGSRPISKRVRLTQVGWSTLAFPTELMGPDARPSRESHSEWTR